MKKLAPRRLAVAAIILFSISLLAISSTLSWPASAHSIRARQRAGGEDVDRRARHARLKSRLASKRPGEFRDALASLSSLDEQGALDLWRAALDNADPQFQKEAWNKFQEAQPELARKEFIPQVARIGAPPDEVLKIAEKSGLGMTVWSATVDETVAAAPPYLIERLGREGVQTTVIYDSIADWQKALARGDRLAQSITPEYQAGRPASESQVRIAVVDLARGGEPARGYSKWLGDRENVLMRSDSFVAYLDIFSSDGSPSSINSHILEQYTRRGNKLAGFYTPEEFASVAGRLFPGKSFDAGRRANAPKAAEVRPALANGRFHSYEETLTEFRSLANSRPDLARYVKLGQSYEGREVFALKIGKDASVDDSTKPDVLITGCHHAREWISVESPVYFANRLVNNYATDDSIKYLVDHLQIWIVPIMNPDGLTFSQGSPNDGMDVQRMWRKNRRPINTGGCVSSTGVDLNRNYDFQWRLRNDNPCSDYCSSNKDCLKDDIGASDDPNSEIYRGPQAESEPEVRAIKNLTNDPNRHFLAQLDYHNYSQLILYPWSYQQFPAPDDATLSSLAERMSDEIRAVGGKLYKPEQSIDLYATTGSSTDYAYGVNRVAVPLVVEMRPNCCDFKVAESEIAETNEENWSGARTILNWAAGPPILEAVRVYSSSPGSSSPKLVYSARWANPADPSTSVRQLVVDTRFPGIEPGKLRVQLQFSKAMNTALAPRATLGRGGRLDELRLVSTQADEGWQKSVYQNDTWIGETVITQDANLTDAWQLAVSANDTAGLSLDASPETIAKYAMGTGHWAGYEDSDGTGSEGGLDTVHALSPTLRGDFPEVFIASPGGGERLVAGESFTAAWTVPKETSFHPSQQGLYLSIDGGQNFERLAEEIRGTDERYQITLPLIPTTRARLRLVAVDGSTGSTLIGDSQADFTIGANVGSGIEINLASSEKVNQNWTDSPSEEFAGGVSGSAKLILNVRLTNRGGAAIANPFLRVDELNRGNVLLARDPQSRAAVGARQLIDAGGDNLLSPGESAQARLVIGLVSKKKFNLSVQLYGVPVTGTVVPASAVNIWSGKPKNR
jgi:carboxypeptidase T